MRTRVKICGITRQEDALEVSRLGADAIGLVFYPPSPRAVKIDQARRIVSTLPPFVTVVALFVDAEPSEVETVLDGVRVDLLQFHGSESSAQCQRYGIPYIKAVRVCPGIDLYEVAGRHASARGLLLDAYSPGVPGGTGQTFDWALIPEGLSLPVILAGGLTEANVQQAVRQVRPYAVDVSGGVESAKGIKSAAKMAAFIRGVNSVDENRLAMG